jgi:hypothetical protein
VNTPTLEFTARVWLYPGETPWHFITVPTEHADELRERATVARRGFGSLKVEATIGKTTWSTSVFPDRASGSYLLPLKRSVREAEGFGEDDPIEVALAFI